MKKKIRVLVLDDSLVFREVLSRGIGSDEDIEIVAKATDPFDARDKILQFKPDVMTCDVEMPRMNGIEFVRKLMPQYPLPIIVVSSVSDAVFDAMNAGAVDFVTKPNVQSPTEVENFILELISKVKIAASAKIIEKPVLKVSHSTSKINVDKQKVIAIGASTGGTRAINDLILQLPPEIPGIVIVQHIPPVFSKLFAERLHAQTKFNVKEAENGDYLESGKILIAPGDQHMIVRKIGDRYKVELFKGEKINGHCPSVDVLFESVAKECRSNAIGIILTGMGYDGAKGLLSMKRKGAQTIGQDEASSVVYGMPKVAYEVGAVEKQAPLEKIPQVLLSLLK